MANQANDASSWREFERHYVTHSMAHYLTAVSALRRRSGYARATDVAEFLNVSRGAASMALAQLKKREWITEDANRYLLLTETGRRIAERVERNFLVLSRFFERVLGVTGQVARSDACKMEHLLSGETGERLVWLMQCLLDDAAWSREVRARMAAFSNHDSHGGFLDDWNEVEDDCVTQFAETGRFTRAMVSTND